MINGKIIFKILGQLVLLEALMLAACLAMGIVFGEHDWMTFGIPLIVALAAGIGLKYAGRRAPNRMGRRDGFLCVSLSWLTFSVIGSLPLLIGGATPRISAAFFETMSGFTTTGATVLDNIDTLPHSLLLWRSLTHWFGGMGIVFFTIAILPSMGSGDLRLFSAEASGLKLDKLHPRISTTARWIWAVYLLFTIVCAASYYWCGMSVFDAVNHAFSTVATGGFSTHQASMAYFASPRLEWVSAAFMFLAGVNFALLYLLLIKRRLKAVWRDGEFRFYLSSVVGATLVIAAILVIGRHCPPLEALRQSFFNVASFQSSTGLTSNDPQLWPQVTWIIIILVAVCGACAGSTTGGIKCVRILAALKLFVAEFRHMLHPSAVLPIRIGGRAMTPMVMQSVFAFFLAYGLLAILGTIGFLVLDVPLLDAFTTSVMTLSNTGPTFGNFIGPLDAWNAMPDAGLWLSSFLMLAGRLEFFSLLLPLAPTFWHDN